MRITRETLLKLAKDTVQMRVQRDRGVMCVYLTGSLLGDDPLLGGTTDIDLIFVHDREPLIDREIVRLSDEVHLDIAHYAQSVFHQPRHLRVDPWIGPFLCYNPLALHDNHHWFEFTQASVCAQFNQPEYVLERVRAFAAPARQAWMEMHMGAAPGEIAQVNAYLKAVEQAGNAVASFSGPPLTARRMLQQLPERSERIGRPGMAAGLVDLFAPDLPPAEAWQAWQEPWAAALDAAGRMENAPARLHPQRKGYYMRAAAALWSTHPEAAVWLALTTWTRALTVQPGGGVEQQAWQSAVLAVGLDQAHLPARLDSLDSYLDGVEESMDDWAQEYGIESGL